MTTGGSLDSDDDDDSGWSDRLEEIYEQTKSFHTTHQKFFIRLSLALSVAFWVTLFSLPLYFGKLHYCVFGFRGELHETYSAYGRDPGCKPEMVGKMRNIGSFKEPEMVQWTPDMTPWHDNLRHRDIWCGYLPATWEDYWPNIAQFIVFTVYASTGDTVRLAWQGLIGTAGACINLQRLEPKTIIHSVTPFCYILLVEVLFAFLARKIPGSCAGFILVELTQPRVQAANPVSPTTSVLWCVGSTCWVCSFFSWRQGPMRTPSSSGCPGTCAS